MGYIEERIKFLAVKTWQLDKSKHEMNCGNPEGCEFGLIRAELYEEECRLMCDECGHQQEFIPKAVIDNFLDRI